jgi:energy-coupling factor transporter ATP-binding protein EcfA2
VGAGFHPQLTGRENIYVNGAIIGMPKAEIDRKLDQIIAFAGIEDALDTPVKFYSSGMFVRLGMSVAMHTDPDILLVDEVFAVGDVAFQAKCFNKIGELRRKGVAFILVSHNIHHIGGYSDRVLVLENGHVHTFGNPADSVGAYLALLNETQRKSKADLEAPATNGSGRIRFLDIAVCDVDGRRITNVDADRPVRVVIQYDAAIDCPTAELDVGIYTSANTMFFQGSTRLLEQTIPIRKGRGVLAIDFACLPANNDCLMFAFALWDERRSELFDWRRGLTLHVRGCSLSLGSVWLTPRFCVSCSADLERERLTQRS